jgi:hypothetical protein
MQFPKQENQQKHVHKGLLQLPILPTTQCYYNPTSIIQDAPTSHRRLQRAHAQTPTFRYKTNRPPGLTSQAYKTTTAAESRQPHLDASATAT